MGQTEGREGVEKETKGFFFIDMLSEKGAVSEVYLKSFGVLETGGSYVM